MGSYNRKRTSSLLNEEMSMFLELLRASVMVILHDIIKNKKK